jgi:hypothetical protein
MRKDVILVIAAVLVGIVIAVGYTAYRVQSESTLEHRTWVCTVRGSFTADQCSFIANELYYAMQHE